MTYKVLIGPVDGVAVGETIELDATVAARRGLVAHGMIEPVTTTKKAKAATTETTES